MHYECLIDSRVRLSDCLSLIMLFAAFKGLVARIVIYPTLAMCYDLWPKRSRQYLVTVERLPYLFRARTVILSKHSLISDNSPYLKGNLRAPTIIRGAAGGTTWKIKHSLDAAANGMVMNEAAYVVRERARSCKYQGRHFIITAIISSSC